MSPSEKRNARPKAEGAAEVSLSPEAAERDIGEEDWKLFNRLTSVDLDDQERVMAATPDQAAPGAAEFLAVHWHPEWVPLELVAKRLESSFPDAADGLAIPTQHNKVMVFGPWAGVEADAYDRRYSQKVQLLIHFRAGRLAEAGSFLNMVEHTYNYRAHQFLDILNRLAAPGDLRPQVWSSTKTSIQPEAWQMARFYAVRLRAMIETSGLLGSARDEMLKNRLLPDFMEARIHPDHAPWLEQALAVVKAVKKSVKAELGPEAFYSPQELIEEARSFGAGVVIPHPPVFWPILLSDLDVDGWEVWNPSTPDHAAFLSEALIRANANPSRRKRPLLVFMGDDTHMSSKIRPTMGGQKGSADREIGFQPPWRDPAVDAILKRNKQSRTNTINEYRGRLLSW